MDLAWTPHVLVGGMDLRVHLIILRVHVGIKRVHAFIMWVHMVIRRVRVIILWVHTIIRQVHAVIKWSPCDKYTARGR